MARKKKTRTVWVGFTTFVGILDVVSTSRTVYMSVPVQTSVNKITESAALKIIKEAQNVLLGGADTNSLSGTVSTSYKTGWHTHRSIDAMRVYHAYNQRLEVFSIGNTKPGGQRLITIFADA